MSKSWIAAGVGALVLGSSFAQAAEKAPAAKVADKAPVVATTPAAAPVAPVVAPVVKTKLTKDEALKLMSLQYTIAIVENNYMNLNNRFQDRAELLLSKYLKEGERKDYRFDPILGKFFLIADWEKAQAQMKADAEKNKGTDMKLLLAGVKSINVETSEAVLFNNLQNAIAQARNDLSLLYTKRQDMVKELMDRYSAKLEDSDIDVLVGNIIERAKTEEAPAALAPVAKKAAE